MALMMSGGDLRWCLDGVDVDGGGGRPKMSDRSDADMLKVLDEVVVVGFFFLWEVHVGSGNMTGEKWGSDIKKFKQ